MGEAEPANGGGKDGQLSELENRRPSEQSPRSQKNVSPSEDDDLLSEEYVFDDESDIGVDVVSAEVQSIEQRKGSQVLFRALTPEELRLRMHEILQESTELLGVDEEVASLLLRTYRWHADDLIQEWYSDRGAVLKKSRLPPPQDTDDGDCSPSSSSSSPSSSSSSSFSSSSSSSSSSEMFECPITTLVVPFSETSALPCGHRFANECWRMYLEAAILEGPESAVDKRCPLYKCGEVVRDAFWRRFLSPQSFERFQDFQIRLLVERHPALSWCPAPGCSMAVELLREHTVGVASPLLSPPTSSFCERTDNPDICDAAAAAARNIQSNALSSPSSPSSSSFSSSSFAFCSSGGRLQGGDVCCSCGTRFCLYCSEEPHRPVPCNIIKSWNLKNQSEADNMTWILVHTKNCPKCKQPIEKNQGCMHMTCRCGFEFCWLCLGDWKKHQTSNFYRCNVYEQRPPDPSEEKRKKAKESLERYAHFFERYRAHSHGQRVAAEKQMAQVNKQMRILLQRSLRDISEVEFLEEAVKQIIECRRILKWSYAFGYFADWPEARHKHLFEYHQGQLERSLDLLQEKTETFDADDFLGESLLRFHVFKAELIDLTRVIGGFFRKICNVFEDEFCT
ncbi:hypothetical protein NCLIV_050310 [Neospora caninum Liverpool]|uniref:RBR-type E3 ubiquitin transferase n=1 Tax=Neospora caninum (strain Liverpool) TaxID=572307 RepID=F0VKK2_NEOCL|nr:hypothetical protein NCLIV_050310 [Neospora caninum Liverpool]CBZ54603.1 hypothetical protein NCLIV_050310 [Neospora caninum Liverpool]CEL69317.1 TPA: Putative E3 ubiquitin-protein ligase ARI6 [Neospora caninum Liverpool]|eukprot:XP_003884633.1 hypothetical protein NCLIV_050310 [Neospora caninum Liverpool]